MNSVEPSILNLDTFKIIGIKYFGKNQHNELEDLWSCFYRKVNNIKNIADVTKFYGVCHLFPGSSKFSYIASVKVKNSTEIPKDMVYKILPNSKYAVFSHKGTLNSLGQTYEYIYGTWLPKSKYEHTSFPDVEEYYEPCYEDSIKEYSINLYIPIK